MTDVNFEIKFCYRISELLELAHDNRGENIPVYVERKYDNGVNVCDSQYDLYQEEIRKLVAKEFKIDEHYIESISQTEYDQNNIDA